MTKRDLVKWLEAKRKDAEIQAEKDSTERVSKAKELEYKDLGLDEFIDEIDTTMQKFLKQYKAFIDKVNANNDLAMSRYHFTYGYNELVSKFGDKEKARKAIADIIYIKTERYNAEVKAANEYKRNVVFSYDTVIETVKNLPTAKDGLEYLKKLGFDVSEIQPAEQKKQLPATISVNVDVQYLLLNKEKKDDRTTETDNTN